MATVISSKEQGGQYSGFMEYRGGNAASRTYAVDTDGLGSPLSSIDVIRGGQALAVDPLPQFGQILESGSLIVAKTFTAVEDTTCDHWLVTVDYVPRDPFDTDEDQPPDEQPAKVSWGFNEYQETRDEDSQGEAYVNSAGDPMDNAPMITYANAVLTVTQHQATFSATTIADFVGTINKTMFLGAPVDTLKFKPGPAVREYVDGQFYWSVTYTFEYKTGLWNPVQILDRGTRGFDLDTGVFGPILINGIATGKPVLLDGAGRRVLPGGEPHFIQRDPFTQKDFNGLGLRI